MIDHYPLFGFCLHACSKINQCKNVNAISSFGTSTKASPPAVLSLGQQFSFVNEHAVNQIGVGVQCSSASKWSSHLVMVTQRQFLAPPLLYSLIRLKGQGHLKSFSPREWVSTKDTTVSSCFVGDCKVVIRIHYFFAVMSLFEQDIFESPSSKSSGVEY